MESEFVEEWDVDRDASGNPITISGAQVSAIWRALSIVEDVRCSESCEPLGGEPRDRAQGWLTDVGKSRLLGRLLIDGRPPTRTRPPESAGACAWWKLPGGDPFNGTASDVPGWQPATEEVKEEAPAGILERESENPWMRLNPEGPGGPYLHPDDAALIVAYNHALTMVRRGGASGTPDSADNHHVIDPSLPPSPFGGYHDSPLLVLLANPGITEDDAGSYSVPERRKMLVKSLRAPYGSRFWPLTDAFMASVDGDGQLDPSKESGAHRWWREHTRELVEAVGDGFTLEDLADNVLSVEFHGYHSKSFMTPFVTLPSQRFGFRLVEDAMARGALIVVLRAVRQWCAAVPGLAGYANAILGTASTQSVHLTPRNLGKEMFDRIVQVLRESDRRASGDWLDEWNARCMTRSGG